MNLGLNCGVELVSRVMGVDVPWTLELKRIWDSILDNFDNKLVSAKGGKR